MNQYENEDRRKSDRRVSPAIAEAIRSKAGKGTLVTFSCDPSAMPSPPAYAPRQRDNRVTMAESEKVSPVNAVLGIIQKLAK